ncbi:lytic transglycosylase domain-containing protein [Sphingomonas sp.]|uniref:lytic transglycosylase domain-containing protein n=1 Tax=Sphingomonas sp. TaxID=28214 RepID=UPI00286B66AA|nr:lytic transglycosylase domain-containing protein [Sphingomonas sp.]
MNRSRYSLRPSRWALIAGVAMAVPVHAQVIEIGDDGSATTYSKPTRFLGSEGDRVMSANVTVRPVDVDRYEQAAKAEGLDVHLLRAVAWTESRGRQGAVSPKGALGVMQLMPGTAAELGVDPLDPEANLHGGARYLARQLTRFQSVPLALAAYNAGPGAVLRWGGIPPYAETQAYVAQIMSRWQGVSVPVRSLKLVATPTLRRIDLMLIEVPPL